MGYRHFERKSEEMSVVSLRIKNLRERNNETQKQLAEAINLSATNIANIEQDKTALSLNIAKDIAKHYKVSVDYICGLSDDIWGSSATLDTLCHYVSLDTDTITLSQGHEIPVISINKGFWDYLNVLVMADQLKKNGVPDAVIDAWLEKETEKARGSLLNKEPQGTKVKYALLSKRCISSDEVLTLIKKAYEESSGDDGPL